jgi:hypothetical protein
MMKKTITFFLVLLITACHAQRPDLNLSFEKLDTNGMVIGWQSICLRKPPIFDSYEGKYAYRMSTFYVNRVDCFILGSLEREGKEPLGVPFKEKLKKLKGYYKYEYGNNCNLKDSAEVYVYMKRYNVQLKKTDTIGRGKLYLGPSPNYKLFEVPVLYNSLNDPDTLAIEFYSTDFDRSVICTIGENRFFTIDALQLEYVTPTEDINSLKYPINIHPNPTINEVQIDWRGNDFDNIVLRDLLGRTIQKKVVNTEGVSLDLSALPKGLYFIEFNQNGKHIATKKVVKQ